MDMPITLGLMLAGVAGAVFCGWRGAQPKDYAKPRRVPWQLLMLVFAFVVLIMMVHLITLFGVNPAQGR